MNNPTPPPVEETMLREITDTDRWYLKRAEDRRARRLQKRIENQRRADAGKLQNRSPKPSGLTE